MASTPKLKDFSHLLIKPDKSVSLKDYAPDSTRRIPAREKADEQTNRDVERLGQLQDSLYAQGRQSLLVIFQGMDASGKDGAVRKVFDTVNPTGVQVTSFKQPSAEELRHDFIWRCHKLVPPRGYIGVFNRSYYEDVLVVRVHADKLLAPELRGNKDEWPRRFRMIREFEHILSNAGTRILKFFLHISREEQRERFIARQKDPEKHWKLAAGDFVERTFWDDYQHAYEKMLPATSTAEAPWYVVPADHKWARNHVIAQVITATLEDMNPKCPVLEDKTLITKQFK